ncbi:LysM peptidoglycan-binding domain-containing protein [Devosia soli]|nr:LysM peptidoglycan-binding domain-containing protein [Devosia soli]
MGQCIRGKFAEAGLFPNETTTEVAAVEAPAATPTPAPEAPAEADTALTPPALDVTPPAEPEAGAADKVVAATFGLLRAEPDGSVVIAGSGTPGSEVEVFSNGALLGSATVENSGDWVLVPDAPLPPGGVEITLAERGKEAQSEQSFVVVINDDKTSQPLVVASVPGQASEVLQGLDRPAPSAPTQVATAEQTAPVTPAPAPAAPAATPTPPTTATAAPVPSAEAPTTPAPAEQPSALATPPATVPAMPSPETAPSPTPASPATPTPSQSIAGTNQPAQPVPAPEAAPAPSTETASPAAPATEPAAPQETTVAAAPAVEPTPAPVEAQQLADIPPTIDAIEIEGDRTFFAGGGPDGGVVRLYVDDTFIADTTIEGGRWLVEAGAVLAAPSQRVRADLLGPGSSDVLARVEVDFVVDVPAGEGSETAVASNDAVPAEQLAPAEPSSTSPAVTAPKPSSPAANPPAETTTQAAADAPAPVAEAEIPATEPSEPSAPPATPEPSEVPAPAQPQPAAEPAVPTMVAVSVGGPDAQRFASGKAIIRRGDNLWTIARRVYGEGMKYTTIYEANAGQIRDPDRIYPGQVFSLPQ